MATATKTVYKTPEGRVIHKSWVEVGGPVLEIMQGLHDDDLGTIQQACAARNKSRFWKGQKCILRDTKDVTLDGKECIVTKVNTKTISIKVEPEGTAPDRKSPAEVGALDPDERKEYLKAWADWGVKEYNVPPFMLVTE